MLEAHRQREQHEQADAQRHAAAVQQHKNETGSVVGFPGSQPITNEALLELDVTVLFPSPLVTAPPSPLMTPAPDRERPGDRQPTAVIPRLFVFLFAFFFLAAMSFTPWVGIRKTPRLARTAASVLQRVDQALGARRRHGRDFRGWRRRYPDGWTKADDEQAGRRATVGIGLLDPDRRNASRAEALVEPEEEACRRAELDDAGMASPENMVMRIVGSLCRTIFGASQNRLNGITG